MSLCYYVFARQRDKLINDQVSARQIQRVCPVISTSRIFETEKFINTTIDLYKSAQKTKKFAIHVIEYKYN